MNTDREATIDLCSVVPTTIERGSLPTQSLLPTQWVIRLEPLGKRLLRINVYMAMVLHVNV
ncbi:hypothetical protein FACS1894158_06060 [Betaproteobacteria bacterium]|nr:hypothetical protein FACS1894158_06060 [Betaproteobacteria bacterium]